MALIFKERVKENTTTTGTGTLTLTPIAQFQAFSGIGDGNQTYYGLQDGDSLDWEVGVGTYTLAGTELSRDQIIASSNNGNHITISGTSTVFCTYPAEKAIIDRGTDANPLVGLGTTSPLANLDIVGSGADNRNLRMQQGTGQTGDYWQAVNEDGQTRAYLDDEEKLHAAQLFADSGYEQVGNGTTTWSHESYEITGVNLTNQYPLTFQGVATSGTQNRNYSFKVHLLCGGTNLHGATYFVRRNNEANDWEVHKVSLQTDAGLNYPELVVNGDNAVMVRTPGTTRLTVGVFQEAIFINRNDTTFFFWGNEGAWTCERSGAGDGWFFTTGNRIGINTDKNGCIEDFNVRSKAYIDCQYGRVEQPSGNSPWGTGHPFATLNLDHSDFFNITLDRDLTLVPGSGNIGQKFLVHLRQTNASGNNVTWWNNICWSDTRTTPTLSPTSGYIDTIGFSIPSGNKYFGYVVGTGIYDPIP